VNSQRLVPRGILSALIAPPPGWSTPDQARPLHHRFFVQLLGEGEQHVGGIIMPGCARRSASAARCSSMGSSNLIMREEDVLAVMDRT